MYSLEPVTAWPVHTVAHTMNVLLNLLVLVGIAALAQAKACEDDVLCTYREDLCRDNVYYQKLCPKICGKCGSKYIIYSNKTLL